MFAFCGVFGIVFLMVVFCFIVDYCGCGLVARFGLLLLFCDLVFALSVYSVCSFGVLVFRVLFICVWC